MSQMIKHIDIERDFWVVNPECKFIFHYIDHNEETSTMMWTYTLFYHPQSAYFEMTKTDKLKYCQEYIGDPKWHPSNDERIDTDFQEGCMTRVQRFVDAWGDKVDERVMFMADTPYTVDTVQMLESMMKNSKSVTDSYQQALAELYKEEEEKTFGAVVESSGEQGLFDNVK